MATEAGSSPCVLDNPKCRSKHRSSTKIGCVLSTLQSIYDMRCVLFILKSGFEFCFLLNSGFKSRFLIKSGFKSLFYSTSAIKAKKARQSRIRRSGQNNTDTGHLNLLETTCACARCARPDTNLNLSHNFYSNLDLSPVFYLNLNLSHSFYSNLDSSHFFYSNLN